MVNLIKCPPPVISPSFGLKYLNEKCIISINEQAANKFS